MNKKTFLFTLLALIAGTLLGYTGKSLRSDAKTTPEIVEQVSTRPRFGDTLSSSAPPSSVSSRSKKTEGGMHLDKELKRYARMSHEELWKELEMMKKKSALSYSDQSIETSILLFYLSSRLGQEAPRQTFQKMGKLDNNSFYYHYSLMEVWKTKNPDAAMAYCQENMDGNTNESRFLKSYYISALSDKSPNKALDYVATLPLSEQSDYLYGPLSAINDKNPEKLAAAVTQMADAIKNSDWMPAQIASFWATKDWNAASQWIQTLPEDKRIEAMGRAVSSLPLEESSQKLATLTGKEKEEAVKQISRNLFNESPQKAVEWLQSHTTEEEAVKAIEKNYFNSQTLYSDKIAFIDQIPPGELKDSLLNKIVQNTYPGDPNFIFFDQKMEDTFSLVSKINSPQKKEQALDQALSSWMYRDPENTKSCLEKADIPAEKKAEYIKRCDSYIKNQNAEQESAGDPFD